MLTYQTFGTWTRLQRLARHITGWKLSSFGETGARPPSTWCRPRTSTLAFSCFAEKENSSLPSLLGVTVLLIFLFSVFSVFFPLNFPPGERLHQPQPHPPRPRMQSDGQRHPLHAGDAADRLPDHSLSRAQQSHGSAHQLCEYGKTCLQTISATFPMILGPRTSSCATCTTDNDVGQTLLHDLGPPKRYLTGGFIRPYVRGQPIPADTPTNTVSHVSF